MGGKELCQVAIWETPLFEQGGGELLSASCHLESQCQALHLLVPVSVGEGPAETCPGLGPGQGLRAGGLCGEQGTGGGGGVQGACGCISAILWTVCVQQK